ncbi:hypothetical protein PIB30_021904 [Stylosanthes scabra]|uniref:Uncharacterized protein n=1 Tax=Stylosanthes scabra TaxID=79078 RepID=A0ABU6S930_9FABA|nr:hypothetical protein [Stylosanthes scabra]
MSTIAYQSEAPDVSFLTQLELHHLDICSSNYHHFSAQRKPEIRYPKYHDRPSFSLGEEFNTPTPSPDEPASKDVEDEVLDIPAIREILSEDIVLNAEEDPCTI